MSVICLDGCDLSAKRAGQLLELAFKDIDHQQEWISAVSTHMSSRRHIVEKLRRMNTFTGLENFVALGNSGKL